MHKVWEEPNKNQIKHWFIYLSQFYLYLKFGLLHLPSTCVLAFLLPILVRFDSCWNFAQFSFWQRIVCTYCDWICIEAEFFWKCSKYSHIGRPCESWIWSLSKKEPNMNPFLNSNATTNPCMASEARRARWGTWDRQAIDRRAIRE